MSYGLAHAQHAQRLVRCLAARVDTRLRAAGGAISGHMAVSSPMLHSRSVLAKVMRPGWSIRRFCVAKLTTMFAAGRSTRLALVTYSSPSAASPARAIVAVGPTLLMTTFA